MTAMRALPFVAALLLAACVTTSPLDPSSSGRKDAGDIYITLKDAAGKPLEGRSVAASIDTSKYVLLTSPLPPPRTASSNITDQDGLARIGSLQPGTYLVQVQWTQPLLEKRITVAGGVRVNQTWTVPAGTVFGTPAPKTPMPSPSTTASPTPTVAPSPSPTATADPNATPTPSPTATAQ